MDSTRPLPVQPERRPAAVGRAGRASEGSPTGDTGTRGLAIRARITITPWTHVAFATAAREILQEVRMSPEIEFGTGAGSVLAQRLLRARGYAHARVVDARDVDEAMRRVAHWLVLRDG